MTRDIVADDLRRQADAARELVRMLAEDGHYDPDLISDMTEAETTLHEAVDRALAEIDECDVMVDGIKAKEAEFAARRRRAEGRIERVRGMIEQALVVSGVATLKLATGTLSIRDVPPKPIIAEEAEIPAEFWKQPDPVLDKTAINKAVKDGRTIPGVTMSNGGVSLQIRRA